MTPTAWGKQVSVAHSLPCSVLTSPDGVSWPRHIRRRSGEDAGNIQKSKVSYSRGDQFVICNASLGRFYHTSVNSAGRRATAGASLNAGSRALSSKHFQTRTAQNPFAACLPSVPALHRRRSESSVVEHRAAIATELLCCRTVHRFRP